MCFFCSRYIFTTYRKSNQDIVLLQPSIIDDSIQARRLWAGLLGSVIHSVRRSEESSGDKEEEKQEVGRRFRKKQKGEKQMGKKRVKRGGERTREVRMAQNREKIVGISETKLLFMEIFYPSLPFSPFRPPHSLAIMFLVPINILWLSL